MSVYKHPKSQYWRYDFQIDGVKYRAPIRDHAVTTKKQAQAYEARVREKVEADLKQQALTGSAPMTFDMAAGRFWHEVGQHHVNSRTTLAQLKRLGEFFGKTKRLDEITDADVAALVAWRRAHKSGKGDAKVTNATVNRTTLIPLKTIFNRAKHTWKLILPKEPHWRSHMLKEPQERVRELTKHEAHALDNAMREDYRLWFAFARVTGLRFRETLITWKCVKDDHIATIGKGGRTVTTAITPTVRAILEACRGLHPVHVFTYVCRHPEDGRVRGQRYPLTVEGAKDAWKRARARTDVEDFRFHDIRHDVATKLLRATGNLKKVQQQLNHASITHTVKYAHVDKNELAADMEALTKSLTLSLTIPKKVA